MPVTKLNQEDKSQFIRHRSHFPIPKALDPKDVSIAPLWGYLYDVE